MALWTSIAAKLKGVLNKMVGTKTIERELNIAPVISPQMEIAIATWSNMYQDKASWLHEPDAKNPVRVVSLGLPALIASEKARTALIEFNSEITPVTEEFEVENPDYEEPKEDEFGNIIPSTQKPTIMEEQPVGDTTRAEFLEEQYKKLKKQLRKQIEIGIAKGGLVIKPYPVFQEPFKENANNNPEKQKNPMQEENRVQGKETEGDVNTITGNKEKNPAQEVNVGDKNVSNSKASDGGKQQEEQKPTYTIEFDFIQADSFYPLAFNVAGEITEAAFLDVRVEKDAIYRRLEYHKWEKSTLTVINKAYKSSNVEQNLTSKGVVDLGKEIPLTEVPEWSSLQEKTVVAPVSKPLFAYFKMPEANTIDMTSPLGVSGFSRAVHLIKDADMQYSRLLWEFEAGEMAIDIDRDALNFVTQGEGRDGKKFGKSTLGSTQQRLFRKVDLGNEGDFFNVFAPALRDASLVQGLNTILMRIEDVTGLSRGTLSDAAAEARTATELKILKQRSYQTNADIQQAIEDALRDVVYAMNAYCDLYEITPPGEYDVNFEWDDSIIVDVDMELNKRMTLLQNGLTSKLELRMWYFGETERQAREALQQVGEESTEQMEQDLMMQGNLNQMNNPFDKGENPFDKKEKKDEDSKKENPFDKKKKEGGKQ